MGRATSKKKSDRREFEVKEIVDCDDREGVLTYRVRWKGYPPDEDSWLTEQHLDCPLLITKFWNTRATTEPPDFPTEASHSFQHVAVQAEASLSRSSKSITKSPKVRGDKLSRGNKSSPSARDSLSKVVDLEVASSPNNQQNEAPRIVIRKKRVRSSNESSNRDLDRNKGAKRKSNPKKASPKKAPAARPVVVSPDVPSTSAGAATNSPEEEGGSLSQITILSMGDLEEEEKDEEEEGEDVDAHWTQFESNKERPSQDHGFARGLMGEKILVTYREGGKEFAVVKFLHCNLLDSIQMEIVKRFDPLLVLRYREQAWLSSQQNGSALSL